MSKLVPICKKCGWKHLEWEGCKDAAGLPAGMVRGTVTVPNKIIPSVAKEIVELIPEMYKEGEVISLAPNSRAEYMAERRKSCKWALKKILGMTDVGEIHALAKEVLEK